MRVSLIETKESRISMPIILKTRRFIYVGVTSVFRSWTFWYRRDVIVTSFHRIWSLPMRARDLAQCNINTFWNRLNNSPNLICSNYSGYNSTRFLNKQLNFLLQPRVDIFKVCPSPLLIWKWYWRCPSILCLENTVLWFFIKVPPPC